MDVLSSIGAAQPRPAARWTQRSRAGVRRCRAGRCRVRWRYAHWPPMPSPSPRNANKQTARPRWRI